MQVNTKEILLNPPSKGLAHCAILDTVSLLTAFPTHTASSNRATPIQGTRPICYIRKKSKWQNLNIK